MYEVLNEKPLSFSRKFNSPLLKKTRFEKLTLSFSYCPLTFYSNLSWCYWY